jgi:hypothetical protein
VFIAGLIAAAAAAVLLALIVPPLRRARRRRTLQSTPLTGPIAGLRFARECRPTCAGGTTG